VGQAKKSRAMGCWVEDWEVLGRSQEGRESRVDFVAWR
jgi:hypothetical protein